MTSNDALHFDPTQDELDVLKHIEMTGPMAIEVALKRHISPRLTERGYLARGEGGSYVITANGRDLIRRVES